MPGNYYTLRPASGLPVALLFYSKYFRCSNTFFFVILQLQIKKSYGWNSLLFRFGYCFHANRFLLCYNKKRRKHLASFPLFICSVHLKFSSKKFIESVIRTTSKELFIFHIKTLRPPIQTFHGNRFALPLYKYHSFCYKCKLSFIFITRYRTGIRALLIFFLIYKSRIPSIVRMSFP